MMKIRALATIFFKLILMPKNEMMHPVHDQNLEPLKISNASKRRNVSKYRTLQNIERIKISNICSQCRDTSKSGNVENRFYHVKGGN